MKTWQEIVHTSDRYHGFTIVEEPQPFYEMFAGIDIPHVQLHSVTIHGGEGFEDIVGFCGVFEWKYDAVTSLDGDSYSSDMKVLGYEWFENEDHQKCLDILIGNDW